MRSGRGKGPPAGQSLGKRGINVTFVISEGAGSAIEQKARMTGSYGDRAMSLSREEARLNHMCADADKC